jgi:hypothetical protein
MTVARGTRQAQASVAKENVDGPNPFPYTRADTLHLHTWVRMTRFKVAPQPLRVSKAGDASMRHGTPFKIKENPAIANMFIYKYRGSCVLLYTNARVITHYISMAKLHI